MANALVPRLRAELDAALRAAISDEDVRAIVLHGRGKVFSSGIDITEYDRPLSSPLPRDICALIDSAPKPVVAALHGAALGAGLELALAAHGRVIAKDTRLAIPDITLGLLPAGGATQRLPRLIGAQATLDFMLSGRVVPANDPLVAGLWDRLVDAGPLQVALELAREFADQGRWPRSSEQDRGFADPAGYQKSLAEAAERLKEADGIEADLLKCIEAAQLLPFERGLELEMALFEDRLSNPEAICRRHLFAATRRAAIMPELGKAGALKPLGRVVMLGNDPVLAELAVSCLDFGQHVTLIAETPEQAEQLSQRTARLYDGAVHRRNVSKGDRDIRMGRLSPASGFEPLSSADLIFDTDEISLPDGCPRPDAEAIWAVIGGAERMARRTVEILDHERVLGLRLYKPAYRPRMVEMLVPDGCHPQAVAGLAGFFTSLRRTVIREAATGQSVGDRMQMALLRAALALVDAGASPYEIDRAARRLGFLSGPFERADAEGLRETLDKLTADMGDDAVGRSQHAGLLDNRIAAGATGKAAGKGIYLYPAGRDKEEDRAVLGWIESRKSDPDGVVERLDLAAAMHAALVNEASRLVMSKTVLRASDIDVVMVKGARFDPVRGGPLIQADLAGLLGLLKVMKLASPLAPDIWRPTALVESMVKNGQGFFRRPTG